MAVKIKPVTQHIDVTLKRGDTWTFPMRWGAKRGEAFDLSTYTARMHLRDAIDDAATRLELTEVSGIELTDGLDAEGEFEDNILITITAAQSADFDFEAAGADLELIAADGTVTTLAEFAFDLDKDWTR